MENKEKFQALLKDEDFVAKILELQTPEEVQKKFAENEVELTIPEVQHLGDAINYMIENGKTELTEDDLSEISGGEKKRFGGGKGVIEYLTSDQAGKDFAKELVTKSTDALIAIALIPVAGFTAWGTSEVVNAIKKAKNKKGK